MTNSFEQTFNESVLLLERLGKADGIDLADPLAVLPRMLKVNQDAIDFSSGAPKHLVSLHGVRSRLKAAYLFYSEANI